MEKNFTIDPAIIYSLISKQASGLPKGLLELAMNSVDAGATRIDLNITNDGFVFSDNGKGFTDLNQIEACFETFGTPHKAGDAEYGKFRLGRAQIFCYGSTTWHSKHFEMVVDLKNKLTIYDQKEALGYTLREVDSYFDGCKITGVFYDSVNLGTVDDSYEYDESLIIPQFIKMIKYLPVDLYINGKIVTSKINNSDVYKIDDNAYFLLKELSDSTKQNIINVYNKGVFAFKMHSNLLAGDIVTKKALDLNMARNEAKKTCPVYKAIKNKISKIERDLSFNENGEKRSFTDDEAREMINAFWSSLVGFQPFYLDEFEKFIEIPLFKNGNDTKVSLKKIILKTFGFQIKGHAKKQGIILFNQNDLVQLDRSVKDFIKPDNGFINSSILPSTEIMNNIDFEVYLPNITLSKERASIYELHQQKEFYLTEGGESKPSNYIDFLFYAYEVLTQIKSNQVHYYGVDLGDYNDISQIITTNLNAFNKKVVVKTVESRLRKVKLDGFKFDFVKTLNTLINVYYFEYIRNRMNNVFHSNCGKLTITCVSSEECRFKNIIIDNSSIYITDQYLDEVLSTCSLGEIVFDILHQVSHSFMNEATDSHGATFIFANSILNHKLYYSFYDELMVRILRLILKNVNDFDSIDTYGIPKLLFEKIVEKNLNYFEQYA